MNAATRPSPGLFRGAIRRLLGADQELDRVHAAMADIAGDVAAKNVIDVGCDDGAWVLELSRRLGIPKDGVYGVEIQPKHLAAARANLTAFNFDLETQRWPFEDQTLELIVMNQVLEHLKNVYFCLSEAERTLKVGGRLAIGIPNLSGLLNRLWLLLGIQPMCIAIPGPHVRSFAHASFVRFLRSNPAFELTRTLGSSLYPLPWPLLESGARRFPQWAAYSFYLLRKTSHRNSSAWLQSIAAIGASNFTRS